MDEGRVGPGDTSWEALPGRALEVLARACSARPVLGGRPPGPAGRPSAESVERLAVGVTTLAAVLDRSGQDDEAGSADPATHLRRAVDLLAELGEAARRVASGAGVVGQEPAAEVADSVMCAALTLRILAEFVLRAVPPTDAGPRPAH